MGLFDGKTALIVGVANKSSIAWGIAQALHAEGARLGILVRRARPGAPRAAAGRERRRRVAGGVRRHRRRGGRPSLRPRSQVFGSLDVLVHAVAYAPHEELAGRFADTSRTGFHTALDVSAYSLVALARRAAPLMPPGGAILTLTAIGSAIVLPQYNVMGVAKAALEACVRYLADDLGPRGIRVNALSPGAVKTLAASAVPGFRDAYRRTAAITPLRTNVTQDDVGHTALWLCSDWARTVTGEIVYVDAGYHLLGAATRPDDGAGDRTRED